ncbi:MAG: universal stress protein [bacterium]
MDTEASPSAKHPVVVEYATSRPRVLGWIRSAAILDGDWGTSVAYVMGIGFALAGYSSFWHLSSMMVLTTIVALNYITICRLYPNGGGVYNSVYHRSKLLAVIGALLLGADYIVTMALSILDACHYLSFGNPLLIAILVIIGLGVVNWFGPRHSGSLAVIISAFTVVTLVVVIFFSAPAAFTQAHIEFPKGSFFHNWGLFTGFILSLSGIEAISNMTGLMKDPARDSRNAILSVLFKVIIANVFLGLALHAIPGLNPGDHLENMLRFLGVHYVGEWFGWVLALSLGVLLISAGNTALNGLISVQFLMSVDKELPRSLRILNRHGVPILPLVITTLIPIIVLIILPDVETLSHLYAIGLVGAITINLGSTATDPTVSMKSGVKILMIVSAVVMAAIEVSIALNKVEATIFAALILGAGLAARQFAKSKFGKQVPVTELAQPIISSIRKRRRTSIPSTKFLLAMKEVNDKLLKFSIEEAKQRKALLFIIRIKEIAVGALPSKIEMSSNGFEDHVEEMCSASGIDFQLVSIPSYDVGYTISEHAATFGVDRVIIGVTKRNLLEKVLKGNVMKSLTTYLPDEIQLIIFGG